MAANQRALWFLHRLAPDSPAYNMAFTGTVDPALAIDRLEIAYRRVVERHRMLRTGYRQNGASVEHVLFPAAHAEFLVSDGTGRGDPEEEAAAWYAGFADRPFRLEEGRVCRLALLRQGGPEPALRIAVALHHIAGDHYALERFMEALATAYAEELDDPARGDGGREDRNPKDDGYDYADWCAEQAARLETAQGEASLAAWTDLLSPLPPPLDLPTDLPRSDRQGFTGSERVSVWSEDRSARIAAAASALGTTPYVVLFSAFQLFLARLTGQTRFIVGSPSMGRFSSRHRRVIGYCANPLLLPADIGAHRDFAGHVAHTHALKRRLNRHERIAMADVVDRLGLPRDRGRIAIAPCMFTFARHHDPAFVKPLGLRLGEGGQRGAAHDLNLVVNDRDGRYYARWRYSDALFRPETVDAIAADFGHLVDTLCADPTAPYEGLDVPGWRAAVPADAVGMGRETALEHLLAQPPERPALLDGGAVVTHGRLRARALELAARLAPQTAAISAGAAAGDERCVALLLPRGAAQVTAMAACWLAGAAFLPLDPGHPADRLARTIADGCEVAIGQGPRPDWLPAACRWLEPDARDITDPPSQTPTPAASTHPLQTAYRLQTSGSTGEPKSVAVSHGALASYARAVWDRLELPPGAICASLAAPSTDLGYTSLFGTLLNDGTLRLLDDSLALDGVALAAHLTRHPIDALKIVPSHLAALLAAGGPGLLPRHTLILGGETPAPALLERLRELRPDLRIVNHYGPTETTVGITADLLPPEGPVLLGRALPGNRLLVLDDALRPCPSGAVGTLFVAGPQLAAGYHRRPGATAAAFLPDPAGETAGGRLYCTGDRVRRIGDRFQFLGRADGQVKIRGHRVEIGEVESQLQAVPGVVEAAAVILERDGHRQIAAVLAGSADPQAVRDHLAARLPAAMVPDHWRRIEALPRTANGKIDRRALQTIVAESPAAATPDTAPAGPPPEDLPALATLRRIWQTVLRRPDILPDADFFALGGDSILALQMVAAARREGIAVTVQDLFRTSTLAGLVALTAPPTADEEPIPEDLRTAWTLVLHRDHAAGRDQFFALGGDSILVLQLVAECRRRGIPLTPQDVFAHPRLADLARHLAEAAPRQPVEAPTEKTEPAPPAPALLAPMERWFFLSQPDQPDHWNQSLLLTADRLPPEAHLRRALGWVAARHPALTTRYRPEESGWRPVAVFCSADILPPGLFDRLDCATQAEEEALCRAAERGLSIQDGPIFRVLALARQGGGGALFLTAHHLAVDGVSWRILLGDLLHALDRLSRNLPLPTPEPDGRYRRWAADRAGELASLEVSEARRYAAAIHGRCPDSRTAGAAGHEAARWGMLDRRTVTLDAPSTAALLAGSPHQRLLAAWLMAWHAAGGQDQALVDVEEHGRDAGCDDCVGWFTARFPVLFDGIPQDPAILVEAVTRKLATVPPGIRRWGAALSADGILPRAESCVNYLGVLDGGLPGDGTSLPGLRLRPWPLESQRAPDSRAANPVTVDAWVVDGRLTASLAIQGERYDAAFQSRLAAAFAEALRLVGDGDTARIAALLPAEDVAGDVEDIWPLTATQRGMLFQCLLEGRHDLYLNTTILDIDADLEPDRLRAALAEVCLRHPITRAHAVWDGLDEPRLVIRRRATPDIRVLPTADGDAGDPDALLAAEAAAPFDLATAPLMRFALRPLPGGRTRLVWTRHHLVVDGWTSALLLEELFRNYAGLPQRAAPPRMADYFAWTARQPVDEALEAWRSHLAGGSPCHPVPPEISAAAPVNLDWQGGEPLAAALRKRAGGAGVTLGSLMQFAWAAALGFERGRDDVTIGLTVAGRPAELPGVERMTGVFINSLPLRVRLDPAQPVDETMRRLQQDSAPLRTAMHLPLPDILRAAGWDAGQAPFDTLLVLDNYPLPSAVDSGLPAVTLCRAEERSHFPITLQALPEDGLPLLCRINTDRCDRSAAEALFARFRSILTRLALSGTETLDSLARHTSPPGLRQGDWGPSVAMAPDWWVGSAILARAGEAPDAVAVETAAGPLTYGTLARSARAIARSLRRRGIGPEQRVAVALDRGPDLLPALLGVLLAGAAYVPLDPAQPQTRIADILDQAGASLLLTSPEAADIAASGKASIETATSDALIREAQGDADDGAPPPCPHPEQAAYVIFTSGSTGRPKGVTVRHAGLSNLLRAMATRLPLNPQDRWLAVTTVGFDIAALELFGPLIAGATVVLAPEAAQRDPAALLRLAERHRTGILQATPASWAMLAELDSPAWTGLRALTGGEALPGPLAARLLARGVSLLNVYGPTETTIWSTASPVGQTIAAGDAAAPAVPIGGPLDNTGLYVLDAALNPLPPGAEGELWIGGEGLARGYHRRPDLTAAAFLPDPFTQSAGARMYRTGDLVRRRADGALVFLGRSDFQVKLRGHRIELGDIEAALLAQPGVAAAVVRLWDGGPGSGPDAAFLAAYAAEPAAAPAKPVALDGGLDGDRLRAALAERLPAAMVPAVVTVLPALPLNPNGKVDRNALPRPGKPRAVLHAPPQGDTERWLAGIWGRILGIDAVGQDAVGRDDDFFALGGNSLSATRLVAAIRRENGADLPLAELYRNPTIAGLAAHLSANAGAPARRADDLAAMADLLDDLE
ncbi:amino acid adenylation domain-containing protein [Azospirillum sp. 412522]|nr:amino acid adenylation domain-containing protein [Azospirillum sp. 412522]